MTAPRWVVRRDGSADEILPEDGTWATMAEARWFASQAEALEATVPEGDGDTGGGPSRHATDVAAHRAIWTWSGG